MYKKGQNAMEFLMTYGWAILVMLIAVGALAYFGVLGGDCRCNQPVCKIAPESGSNRINCCVLAIYNNNTKTCQYSYLQSDIPATLVTP